MRFSLVILSLWLYFQSFAQKSPSLELKDDFVSSDLIGFVSKYDAAENEPERVVLKSNEFEHSSQVPSFDADFKYHWLKIKLNSEEDKKLVIEYQQIFIDEISFFLFENDSLINQENSSWKKSYSVKSFASRYHAFSFSIEKNKTYTILLKCHNSKTRYSNRGFIKLFDKNFYQKESDFYLMQISLSVGCLIFVAILAIGFFSYSKKRIYLFYTLYIVSMAWYILVVNGIINQFFNPGNSIIANPQFGSILVVFNLSFHALYVNQFFKISKKIIGYSFFAFLILCILQIILLLFVPNSHLPFGVIYISFSLLVIWTLASNYKPKRKAVFLYLAASGPLFITFLFVILGAIGITKINSIFYNYAHIPLALEGIGLGLALLYLFNDERKKIELELQRNKEETTHKILFAQEEERQRLARDLHDDLGGSLSVLNRELDEFNQKNEGKISDSVKLTNKIVDDLRLISHQLMPSSFSEKGLVAVINETVDLANRQHKIKFGFITNGTEKRLHPDSEINIYRIVKELINNALKHSEATESTIQLIYFEEFLYFSIEDNGHGFDISQSRNWGIGFKNINLRAGYLKAKLNIESGSAGSLISLEIPYDVSEN